MCTIFLAPLLLEMTEWCCLLSDDINNLLGSTILQLVVLTYNIHFVQCLFFFISAGFDITSIFVMYATAIRLNKHCLIKQVLIKLMLIIYSATLQMSIFCGKLQC